MFGGCRSELEADPDVVLTDEAEDLLRLPRHLGSDAVAADNRGAMRSHALAVRAAMASINSSRPNSNCSSSLGNRCGAAATQFGNSDTSSDAYTRFQAPYPASAP